MLQKLELTTEDIQEPVHVTRMDDEVCREDSWIFEATSVHLGAMYSPEALAVLLIKAESLGSLEEVREQTNYANKRKITPLHVAAMSSDGYSVKYVIPRFTRLFFTAFSKAGALF